MMGPSLEQRMEPDLLLINEYELARIAHELDTHIFNQGQEEKLHRRYQDYLYRAYQGIKRETITEEQYLTAACFYLFPVEQLNLSFAEEKKQFFAEMKKKYQQVPLIVVCFSDEEQGFEATIDKKELKDNRLVMETKESIKEKLDSRTGESLLRLQRENTIEFLHTRIADAYGMVYITPVFFDHKTKEKYVDTYREIAGNVTVHITKPFGL